MLNRGKGVAIPEIFPYNEFVYSGVRIIHAAGQKGDDDE